MKTKLLLALALTATLGSAKAATVTGNTFDFSGAPAVSGGVLLDGVKVTAAQLVFVNVGYFNSGFDVSTAVGSSDNSSLLANFNIVNTAFVGNTTGGFGENYDGLYDTGGGPLVATAGAPAIGQSLYTMFGQGAAVLGLVNSGQLVTVDGFPPKDYLLAPTAGTIVKGQLGTSTFSASALGITNQSAPALMLVSIPETSSALLGAVGALGLLRRRRN